MKSNLFYITLTALLLTGGCADSRLNTTLTIPKIDTPLSNPFIGWAPWTCGDAGKYAACQPHTLIFSLIDWRVFEPEEGVFDAAALKRSMYYDVWAAARVKFVIRPALDYPGGTAGNPDMYIPRWLYDKMMAEEGSAGVYYQNGYGTGFSPNYESKILQGAHKAFISKLGEVFDKDPNIAFIELGSVGHWGEWHTNFTEGVPKMPVSSVTDIYAKAYADAFPDKKLLMRRPFQIAKDNQMGLYDDSFMRDTATWLQWISAGYVDQATGETQPAMPGFWREGPSGGEIATGDKAAVLADPQACVSLIGKCHTSFIGPSSLTDNLSASGLEAAGAVRDAMGYRLRVDSVLVTRDNNSASLTANWVNDGVAPFYYAWPIELEFVSENGSIINKQKTDWDIRDIMPGRPAPMKAGLDMALFGEKNVTVKVSVLDPDSGKPGVNLAEAYSDGAGGYALFRIADGKASLPG